MVLHTLWQQRNCKLSTWGLVAPACITNGRAICKLLKVVLVAPEKLRREGKWTGRNMSGTAVGLQFFATTAAQQDITKLHLCSDSEVARRGSKSSSCMRATMFNQNAAGSDCYSLLVCVDVCLQRTRLDDAVLLAAFTSP